VFVGNQPRSIHPKVTGPQHPEIFLETQSDENWYDNVGEGAACFYGISYTPSQVAGLQLPQIFWTPYLCPNGLTQSDERYVL